MPDVPRWILVTLLLLRLIAMLVWARGPVHHHGQDVGAQGGARVSLRSSS